MLNARTGLAALSLIVLGAAAGITADRLHVRHRASPAVIQLTHAETVDLLARRVPLRPGQRERVIALLDKRQASIDSAWRQAHLHIQATVNTVVEEISTVLDPDQLPAFRELVRELHGTDPGRPTRH